MVNDITYILGPVLGTETNRRQCDFCPLVPGWPVQPLLWTQEDEIELSLGGFLEEVVFELLFEN